ncbi:peptide synthetase [Amylocarpus encephaloides]|uniref:Peptide synthetase n=1 Tax=Amylocarpus encephaloides TaxID=45428 RepID=A0A9P8C8F2_9HELO|nr:peptide synthetase [Amylocarpus encephaloides]
MPEIPSILNDPPKLLEGPQYLHNLIPWDQHYNTCAIDFTDKDQRHRYTYHEMRLSVLDLANRIQQEHKNFDKPTQNIIPVLVPQCPGLYISQLAILESGGAFCPINLDAPLERIKFVAQDVAASMIITTSKFKDVVSWDGGPSVIIVDESPTILPSKPFFQRGSNFFQGRLAYVMYTSGSSGMPKGVAVSHLAVSQSLLAHERHLPIFKRFLQFAAPSFDVSVFEIFFPLMRGCTLVGCSRSQLLNNLPGTITELEIDAAELTPTVVGSLLHKRANAPCLKLLLTIGEMLTWPIVEEFGGSDTQSPMLYGMYGPTEAAIHCTICPAMKSNTKPGNIGIPFDTVSTFIAAPIDSSQEDSELRFLPLGETGELVLSGPQLADGYLNREEQNKLAFVGFRSTSFYRTGDKARQLQDGSIEILGRMSAGQVKLRGQRIELGEIEEAAYKHPGVKTVAAMVLGGSLIVFALVGDKALDPRDIRDTSATWLPKFMVPSEIVLLQEFPYLPSGKVDKRRLEADYQQRRDVEAQEPTYSLTPTEKIIGDILHNVLGPFPTGMRLAIVGLDSLKAIRVASMLRAVGFNLTTLAVLRAETMQQLAHLCETLEPNSPQMSNYNLEKPSNDVIEILNENSKEVELTMACTPLQAAMLAETATNPTAYYNRVELEVSITINAEQVNKAIHQLAKHNSILRTGFTESPNRDGYVQVVWKTLRKIQCELVNTFEYDLKALSGVSLGNPLKVQIVQTTENTKVLIHLHHSLYDAWSLEILLDDLDIILQCQIPNDHVPFSELIVGYQDGVLKTDEWVSVQYWKDYLENLELRRLPNFHSKKCASQVLAVVHHRTSLSTADIEATARNLGCSPQSIFQAAYALVLASYLGSTDISFGTVFSGRTLPIPGIEDIVGPCLSTLPIRVEISACQTIQELILDLNTTNRKHLEHSVVPLRDIKSSCGVQPGQPLFDTLLVWQQTLHSFDNERKYVKLRDTVDSLEFDLTLEITPTIGNVELKANYQQSNMPKTQVKLLLRQVESIARHMTQSPNLPLEGLFDRLEPEVLSIENPYPEMAPSPHTLTSTVEEIAEIDPSRTAINFVRITESGDLKSDCTSYSELNTHANKMAHWLLSKNVLPDELVCICMEKSADLYTSILATAKAGAGYLPLTHDIPEERLRYIIDEANIRIVLADSSSRHMFRKVSTTMVILVDEFDFSEYSSRNIPPKSGPNDISYCVFTSGSTGTPKGVLVTQDNLLSNLDTLEELYPADRHSRLLQSCSHAFDVSVFEIFFTWRIGGCICAAVKDVIFRDIEQVIRKLHVTHLSLTPTVAALISPEHVPNVQFLVTAGEAVTQKVFNTWADRGLYQGYGPSETTNICTVNPKVTQDDFINNIGPPFKNTSAFVLSSQGDFSLVPRGGEGEFCFGGSQVFRGYMDSAQNVGRIIEHPEYGRLYRSGDFGRLMPDGSLAFTGRKDDQVKIRGQRVELGEINNILLRSEHIQDCVTLVHGDDEDARLICFWTTNPGIDQDMTIQCLPPDKRLIVNLFQSLEESLPVYMIPSALIPISSLPSTTQGKIDKCLLIKLYGQLDVSHLDKVTASSPDSSNHNWTDLELDIARAVSQVTKISLDQVDSEISFFALGIDSISAISLARILRASNNYQVDISQILKNPSVLRLARVLASSKNQDKVKNQTPSPKTDFGFDGDFLQATKAEFEQAGKSVESILPCTPLQEAMLSAGESLCSNLYRNEVLFNVNGDLDKIKECWRQMVKRHGILRTCFVSTDMPRYPYAQVVLREYDLEFGSTKPYDTDRMQPPYSISILTSTSGTQMKISMHHAMYDGVALDVLYTEVEELYQNKTLDFPVSFAPFLKKMASTDLSLSDKFWGSVLRGCSPSHFEHRNVGSTTKTQTHVHTIKASFPLSWLEKNIQKNTTSLLAVCHAAWAALLSEYTQESDICFGSVVSGRTVPVDDIERLVAPCFNTIPTRLHDLHKLTYLEAFRKLQSLCADSLPFQLTPLRRIQSKFSPNGSRLFDTLFILQQHSRELDVSIWEIVEDNGVMDFPVVCEVVPRRGDDTLELILHSYEHVLNPDETMKVLNLFEARVKESLSNPRKQILSSSVKNHIAEKSDAQAQVRQQATETTSSASKMSPEEGRIRDVFVNFTTVPKEKISKDESIFRLGLDSISAVQVATRLRKLGHMVMASDILEHPSIAQLAMHLSSGSDSQLETPKFDFEGFDRAHRDTICSKNDMDPSIIEAILPCTSVQRGMLAQSLHSQGQEYVNSMSMEVDDAALSITRLKAAWSKVCKVHEMLRTGFVTTDDAEHPFVMITFNNEAFHPHFYDGENGIRLPMRDLRRPWFLSFRNKSGKTIMKFTAHHALYDAQSIQMILDDVARACASEMLARRPSVPSLLGAIISASQLNQDDKQHFWQKEENKIIVNRFPDLTPFQTAVSTTSVREIVSQISTVELEKVCIKHGVTMQAAGQVAWARLLAVYIGETSTTFGMTLSGRSVHEDADRTSFPSIITLPVRCDVSGTNAELLSRTMTSNAQLHKYQFTPLTSIQKWAGFPEGKIFDTLFAYQKLPSSEIVVQMPWKVMEEEASVDYAVSMEVQPLADGHLTLRLTFRENVIPVENAHLILRQYDALLFDTLQNPQGACDLCLDFSPKLLSVTPAKEPVLKSEITLLHSFLERGAHQWPSKTAFEFATSLDQGKFASKTWSYDALDKEANKTAQMLVKQGVLPGEIVAICFDKCPEASFAIVGILKAGCAYVALDPNAPIERVKFILEDSGARLVLTAGKPGQNLHGNLEQEIILLDSPRDYHEYSSQPPTLSRAITAQDVSYCLYTSGTTGTPKGCLITHENSVQAMLSFQRLFSGHWTPTSKWLQFASFHFDVSVLEQFWSWSVGICVASAPRDIIFEDIPGTIQRLGITHIDLTPSLARLLHPDEVPSLCKGVFITGGEQLRQEILDVWGEKACIYNGYGPTEATIGVTMYPRVPKNGKPSNIGPQFDNVGSFVLKPGTELPVLRGGVGELCVSGKLVGKGYLNRPDLTAERFPTLEVFGERVYRTGDLVRILHDETFIFLGRADDQVKLRGQRLELTEINEVIKKAVDGLQDIVTLVLKHNAQQKEQLITFFVTTVSQQSFRGMIAQMKSASDSKQLAAMYNNLNLEDLQKLSNSSSQDRGWQDSDKKVVSIIALALDLDPSAIVRSSNIFELGLDSISIISFSRALHNAGLENARLSTIKNNPNIGGLVAALSSASDRILDQARESVYIAAQQSITAFTQKHLVGICQDLGVEARDIEGVAPCTPVQEGMIFRFLEHEGSLYFNKFAFRLDENIDVKSLKDAWKRVVDACEILRTRFVETEDGFAQVVLKYAESSWKESMTIYDNLEKLDALKAPLAISLKKDSDRWMLRLQIFHGLYDGISLTLLLQRIIQEFKNRPSIDYGPSFHLSLPYGPLARVPGAKEFWTEHLNSWVYESLPPVIPSAEVDDIFANQQVSIPGFQDLRKRLGVTPQAIVQAAWMSVLQTVLSSSSITIGMVTSGRAMDFEGAEDVMGPLFNTIPFHCNIACDSGGDNTFSNLIKKCHYFNMKMQDYQHTPLKDIQKWSPAKTGEPLFYSLFVFQRTMLGEDTSTEGVWKQLEDDHVADYPLAFEATMSEDEEKFETVIVAQGGVLMKERAKELLQMMIDSIKEIVESEAAAIIPQLDKQNRVATPAIRPSPSSKDNLQQGPEEAFSLADKARTIISEIGVLAKVPGNSIHQNSSIFELGLDSIDVIKLSSRLKKHDINIPVSAIIQSQSIANMVLRLGESTSKPPSSARVLLSRLSEKLEGYLRSTNKLPNVPGGIEVVLPATPLQQSMVSEMIRSDFERYFNFDVLQLNPSVDVERLRQAVARVLEVTPLLQAQFVEVEDPKIAVSYAQIIPKKVDLSQFWQPMPPGFTLEIFMKLFKSGAIYMARERQKLFHVQFLRARGQTYLIMAAAHALYDGTSMRLIHKDIEHAYEGNLQPRPDFIPFLEQVVQSTTEEAKTFWRTTLSNFPSVTFPSKVLQQDTETTISRLSRPSPILIKDVEALCKSSRITLQTLGQTIWSLVLASLLGQLDVVFGTVLSCRDTEDANEVLFPLMNTVAVRSVLYGTLAEMLAYMQNLSDTTRQYQHFPLGAAQTYSLVSRSKNTNTSLFDTLFIYQGRRQSKGDESLYESVGGASDVEFEVCVEMEVVDDEIVWTTACKSSARTEDETKELLDMMDRVLGRMIADTGAPTIVSDVEGISVCGLPKFKSSRKTENNVAQVAVQSSMGVWSETEMKIRKALGELSGVEDATINRDSTIFHLGLDSILILKLPALLRKEGLKLSVSDILREQTVQAMAVLVANNSVSANEESPINVEEILGSALSRFDLKAEIEELEKEIGQVDYVIPATAGQMYMVRQWQVSRGTTFYPTFSYSISGDLDVERLQKTWTELLARHSILRTGFIEVDETILQVVYGNPQNEIIWNDEPRTSPDLRRPPLSLTVEKSKEGRVLKLRIHHALYDGISLPLIVSELQALYLGHDLPYSPSPSSFKTFVGHSLNPSLLETRTETWIAYLKDAPKQHHLNSPGSSAKKVNIYHPNIPIQSLRSLARSLSISLDSLLLASTAIQYAHHLGLPPTSNLVLGIYLSNRAPYGEDLSALAAPTLNLLPLSVKAPLGRGMKEIAREIQSDITKIGEAAMVGASLEGIYTWTGIRVGCWVNILKSTGATAPNKAVFEHVESFSESGEVVDVMPDPSSAECRGVKYEGYCPAIDIELRYHESGIEGEAATIDVGVFGEETLLGGVERAEEWVGRFRGSF